MLSTTAGRIAAFAVCCSTLVWLWVSLRLHLTPLYGVESDLLGEYIPAARDLAAGTMHAEHYQFHGFGYPLLLAATGGLSGGDLWLAARLLNVAAAGAGALVSFRLVAGFMGPQAACVALVALLVNPVFVRATIEAVTDMPSFALAITATWLLLRGRGWRLTIAGFAAGLALTTRYNLAFLLPAAVVVLMARPGRWRALTHYGAGAVLPIGAWWFASRAMSGDPFGHLNYMNLAYEIYGQGMNWDRFWALGRAQFHSLGDVMSYRPALLLARVGGNLAQRWWTDAHELMPVWLGALAVPGMILSWRRPGWRAMLLHFALCYATLALVFYSPRFFLYLLPFYLSGVAGLLLRSRLPFGRAQGRDEPPPGWLRTTRALVLTALLIASAASAWIGSRSLLATSPDETRLAGPVLRGLGLAGESLMARKPHAAYFGGMRYVPMPNAASLEELLSAGRASGAHYLFFSGIEAGLRRQFGVLQEPNLKLPGLEQLAYRSFGPKRYFALYRFTGEQVDPAILHDSLLVAIKRYADTYPGEWWPHAYLAGDLLDRDRAREALQALAVAEQLGPNEAMVPRMQALGYLATGEYDRAVAASERAAALGSWTALDHANAGSARLMQERYSEAREHFAAAVQLEPMSDRYGRGLGLACFHSGDLAGAIENLERVRAAHPEDDEATLYLARAHLLRGEIRAAVGVLEPATAPGHDPAVRALADSLRRSGRIR